MSLLLILLTGIVLLILIILKGSSNKIATLKLILFNPLSMAFIFFIVGMAIACNIHSETPDIMGDVIVIIVLDVLFTLFYAAGWFIVKAIKKDKKEKDNKDDERFY